MEIISSQTSPAKQPSDCLVIGNFADKPLKSQPTFKNLDKATQAQLTALEKSGDLVKETKSSVVLFFPTTPFKRLLVIGLGKTKNFDARHLHISLQTACNALNKLNCKTVTFDLETIIPLKKDFLHYTALSARMLGENCYRFDRFKTKASPLKLKQITLYANTGTAAAFKEAVTLGAIIQDGMRFTRDLANTPPNHCIPKTLADVAKKLASVKNKITAKIHTKAQIEKLKMGAFLSVAKASAEAPFFIELHYRGGKASDQPTVLVGKGITFDTGGNSLKPGASMIGMKYDMSGAATVLGVFKILAQLKLKMNVIGLIPTCENMIGGNAMRPDDVITSMSGRTIEVLNTDAEGRLILCDALTYAERFSPKHVISIATLTGACVATFGHVTTALLTNYQPLATALLDSSLSVYDKAWQLPLWPEYQPLLNSAVADIANIGGPMGGTITASCFLSRFTEKYHWAHLDIAGTAYTMGEGKKNASGRPIPLLVDFLRTKA